VDEEAEYDGGCEDDVVDEVAVESMECSDDTTRYHPFAVRSRPFVDQVVNDGDSLEHTCDVISEDIFGQALVGVVETSVQKLIDGW